MDIEGIDLQKFAKYINLVFISTAQTQFRSLLRFQHQPHEYVEISCQNSKTRISKISTLCDNIIGCETSFSIETNPRSISLLSVSRKPHPNLQPLTEHEQSLDAPKNPPSQQIESELCLLPWTNVQFGLEKSNCLDLVTGRQFFVKVERDKVILRVEQKGKGDIVILIRWMVYRYAYEWCSAQKYPPGSYVFSTCAKDPSVLEITAFKTQNTRNNLAV